MTTFSDTHQSRWGYHPCDYALYRKLKLLHGWYHQTLRDYAAWRRWARKEPQNRVIREYRRDPQGRKCGIRATRPRPEPRYCRVFVDRERPNDRGVIALYHAARTPQPQPVSPFAPETLERIEALYVEASASFRDGG